MQEDSQMTVEVRLLVDGQEHSRRFYLHIPGGGVIKTVDSSGGDQLVLTVEGGPANRELLAHHGWIGPFGCKLAT